MGITSALVTGLSGLSANQSKLDVVGNNIANVNTIGFKSSRMDFKTQFSETFSDGTAPNGDLGGTNPMQVGLGTQTGAISRNFNDGSREVTGVASNLAVEGDGFFVVKGTEQVYTRDGTFKLNSLNELVTADGMHVQGFGVDSNFSIVPGILTNVTIPVGAMTVAAATQNVSFDGNLNGGGALPTAVSDLTLNQPFYVSNGSGGVTGTAPTAGTLLTQLADATGALYFSPTDTITMTGGVGGRTLKTQSLPVTLTSGTATLGDLMNFINGSLGIDTSAGANGSLATTPGASLNTGALAPAGSAVLQVDGNPGTNNDLALTPLALGVVSSSSTTTNPFSWTKNSAADGESVYTSTIVYDSLGTAVSVNVVATLVDKTTTGNTWRFYATSPDGTGTGTATQALVGEGTITFDTAGQLTATTTNTATIDRSNTGATPNLTFNLNFDRVTGLAGTNSDMAASLQDGSAKGVLTSYSIGNDGIVKGSFSNSLTRTLGQVALATFRNNQGLVDKGNNTFAEGPNSGTAVISAPNQFSAGSVVSGALELSNVDLSSEFVQLISASTGFSAASRVITTSNQLLQELLQASR